jgi:hypothetical protein
MADLLFHFATVFAPGQALRDGRLRAVVYLGVCLPDLLYKGFLYLAGAPTWFCEPTHSPLALLPICYAAALLFEEAWRPRAFAALLAGSWLHLLVDAGKSYMGKGVIPWAFPFSMIRFELGWYRQEDTATMMIAALVVVCVIELRSGRKIRKTEPQRHGSTGKISRP